MVYRNWQQELADTRSPKRRARTRWLVAAGAVMAAAVLACVLWLWPGVLRDHDTRPRSAEDIYLQP